MSRNLSLSGYQIFKILFFLAVITFIAWSWIQSFRSQSQSEIEKSIMCHEIEIFAVKASRVKAWKDYCPTLSNDYRYCLRRDIIHCSSFFPVSFEIHKKTQSFFDFNRYGFSIKCLYTKECNSHEE